MSRTTPQPFPPTHDDIHHVEVTAQDVNASNAHDEVERGVFQQIDERERRNENERPLLSVDDASFHTLSSLYLPSPANTGQAVGGQDRSRMTSAAGLVSASMASQSTATSAAVHLPPPTVSVAPPDATSLPRLQDIVRKKVMRKKVQEQAFLKDSLSEEPPPRLEWALHPDSPHTENYLYATLQGEESRRNLLRMSTTATNHMASSQSMFFNEDEPPPPPTTPGRAQSPRTQGRQLSYFDTSDSTTLPPEQEPLMGSGSRPPHRPTYASTLTDGSTGFSPSMARRYRRGRERGWRGCCQRFGACLAVFFLSPLVGVAVLLFGAAWGLFHYTHDPTLGTIGANPIPLSWWMNLVGRQFLTLQLAYWTQYVLIDGLILNFKPIATGLGPLVTVWAIQAKGFNFIISAWGLINGVLLQGHRRFQLNWLYWTELGIYNQQDIGRLVLDSDLYKRFLVCMVLVGLASSIKRTWFGVSLDRKILRQFKPRLEKLVQDIVVLSEVADLGAEAEKEAERTAAEGSAKKEVGSIAAGLKPRGAMSDAMGGVSFELNLGASVRSKSNDDDEECVDSKDGDEDTELTVIKEQVQFESLQRSQTGGLLIRDRLERWNPPENKADRQEASIKETLAFRRVLMIMDYSEPFGESFGPAVTRDDCIQNANRVYQQLLLLSSSSTSGIKGYNLSFEIIALLARDVDGIINKGKLYQLRKVFRPDGKNELSLLAFVQCCDSVYRRFRYFRASVSNAAVLDRAVESVFDCFFYGIVAFAVAAFLGLNPMPVLLSLSTLLVSFSFAMGSSAASFVEGVFMILMRCPYDLGDRIMITDLSKEAQPELINSYLVSDISLFTTTLTHTATNETSTVKNGSLTNHRLVNCNRSPAAIVGLFVSMGLTALEEDRINRIGEDVRKYCKDNPRSWDNLLGARIDDLSSTDERVEVRFMVRHRSSWQDSARILRDRGMLLQFIYLSAKARGCHYINVPAPQIFYMGGRLADGSVGDTSSRSHLLTENNIIRVDGASPSAIHPSAM